MLSLKDCDRKIKELERIIKKLERSDIQYQQEYVSHLKRILDGLKAERLKAFGRPQLKILERKNDIFDYFIRDGGFI